MFPECNEIYVFLNFFFENGKKNWFSMSLTIQENKNQKTYVSSKTEKRNIEQTIFVFQTGKQNLKKQVLFPILETKLEKASFVSHFGNKT